MSNQFWNQGAYQTQNYTSTQNDFYSGLDNPNFDNDLMNRQVNNNTNNSGGGRNKYIKNVQNQGQIGYLSYQESEPVDSEDLDSFKVELVTIRDKLKKSKKIDFLRGISLANEYLIATLNGTIGTEEQKEVFDELGIYAFLSALKKNSRFANPKIVKQINNFFQRSIHLVLKLLPNDPRGKVSRLILTLFTQSVYQYDYTLNSMKNNFVYFTKRELFEKEELPLNFYQSDSEGSDNEDLNQQKKQKKKKVQIEFQSKKSRKQNQKLREQILHGSSKPKIVYILPRNYYTPLLLLENIELFGRENGFQKICNLLSKPLFDNFDFTNLAPKKISEFFKNKIDIVKYSIRAESVMSGNHPYVEQDTLLLYLFHSSINKVNELISKSKDHDLSKSKRKRNQIASVELEKILSNFIIEKKILEIYLDEKISPEYLELLSPIFSFMSRANKVNGKILKKLWNQSLNQKLSIEIRERLHILIKRYISNVGDSEGMFIFEKYIKKLKKEDYKFPLIDLVYTITEACLKRIKSEKLKNFQSYGLKLFWDMFQEDSGVDVYLSTFARENLQKILKMPQFKLERKNYIDLCIKNINEQKSVLLSLELIRALLIYEAKSKHNIQESQYHLIMKVRQLEKKHNLFDSFIKEFTQYWKLGTIALNNLKNGNFSKNEENEIKIKVDNDNTNECKNNEKENKKKEKGNIKMEKDKEKEKEKEFIFIDSKTILVGQIEHKKQMSYRMNFFNFLTCNCKVPLQYKHIEQLWKILIDKPISKNDKSLLINWLFNIDFVHIDGESTLNSSAITKLFTDKISNFDMDDYSSKEFSIFEKFFRYLNIKKQKIEPEYKTIEINNPYEEEMYFPRMKRTEKVLTGKFLLASTNLWQAEALWNLIMNVKSVDIANKAIRLYVDLYFCLEKSTINNRSARNKYFNSLINQSVNILLEQLKIGKIKQKRIIENTNLINNNNNNNNNTSQNDQDLIEMNNIENRINRVLQFLQFFIKRYDNKFGLKKLLKKDLTRHEDRIGISIGYWLQVNPDALSLKFNGTKLELSYYFKTLKQIFIDDDSIIYISIRNNVELNILAFDKELAFETIEEKDLKKRQKKIEEQEQQQKKKELKKISDRFPAWILVNQHFDIFIQLFEFSINISHEVRGLLLLLPTHSKLLDTFINTSKLINNINNKQDNQNSKDNKVQDNYSNLNVEEKNDNDNLKKKINWDYLIPNKPPSLTLYSLEIIWMQIFKYRPYSFVNDKKRFKFFKTKGHP
ncbi:nnp-1 protein putative nuclear protein 1 nop52 [Anaeramoeba flamelloides]|uniref:Nnp-1 protein putative nuclear protein 1 nop52 n=1 Tax=Anaeramoeba flamelloides TaxID=1746091 RepID=A0ABQ8XMT1_9EUKA|nr:nnp-1 protein putative nuclear protein 1 nop52 [Anaeramoeba flamelloides]